MCNFLSVVKLKFISFRKDDSKAADGEAKGPAAKKVVLHTCMSVQL